MLEAIQLILTHCYICEKLSTSTLATLLILIDWLKANGIKISSNDVFLGVSAL